MMKKAVVEMAVILLLFFLTWFSLAKIDWMRIMKVKQITQTTEEKIGDLFWNSMKKTEIEISATNVISPIDTLFGTICARNHIDKTRYHIHLIRKDEINAFALPNHHIVVYSGLFKACDNEAEFGGVLCHEMAHVENGHVMNKLVKEIGLSVLISISTGKSNPEILKEAIRHLTSSAYDRNLESMADDAAVEYLINAGMDPEKFANFLYRLSENDNLPSQIYWISTHPESKERARKIVENIKNRSIVKGSILGDAGWTRLKDQMADF
jgi:beta-barrel assembly-enhancing protease